MKSIHPGWSLLLLACNALAADVRVEDAWIRAAPPGARVLAGYAHVVNEGSGAVRITGAHGAEFASVVLHQMRMDEGMMRMRALESIEVDAGRSVSFAPGATHLMLNGPKRPLREGDEVVIELRLGDGSSVSGRFVVRRAE